MTKEELSEQREVITKRVMRMQKVLQRIGELFEENNVNDWMLTGSGALLLQGAMYHRSSHDVDIRVRFPNIDDENYDAERDRLIQLFKGFQSISDIPELVNKRYEMGNLIYKIRFFAFKMKRMTVNVFCMPSEEYEEIPFTNISGYKVESVCSVILDKMRLGRDKDMADMVVIFKSFLANV